MKYFIFQWPVKFKSRKDTFRKEGIITKLAFTIGGVDYYEVDDIYSLPFKRGMAAIRIYEEVRMKVDYDYLKAHCMALDNLFKGKQIGAPEFNKMFQWNTSLLERLTNIVDTDLIYKLASVAFFDKNESPVEYDHAYCTKKIEFWKQHESINDFFLREPMIRLIPLLKVQGIDFQTYSKVVKEITQFNWASITGNLSEDQKKILQNNKYLSPVTSGVQ